MLKNAILIAVVFISTLGFSQEEDSYVLGDNAKSNSNTNNTNKGFDWNRATIGGGLGLSFGSFTVVEVAPNFGYYLTDNILVGIGARYSYYKDNVLEISSSVYGGRVYGEYLFGNLPFLAHVETELINLEWTLNERRNIVNVYVGGGIKQRIGGGRSYLYILALYNLNESQESYLLQPNPIITGGIAIGL